MKTSTFFAIFLFGIAALPVWSQSQVWHASVVQTNIFVRGNPFVAQQLNITAPSAGKVIVRFNGTCLSSPGDRIVLAASNIPDWGVNDGNTNVEAVSSDLNRNSFSHTRVYDIAAGSHTYYAVVENFVETEGDGTVSVYASLTVEFYPNSVGQPVVAYTGIQESDLDLEGAPVAVKQVVLNAPTAGKVLVRFDGTCIATPGDRIVLAASNNPNWTSNDGQVSIEVFDGDINRRSFSHVRAYDVAAGSHTFYAVAENYVETDGSGIGSIYGTLTATFFPNNSPVYIQSQGLQQAALDLDNGIPVVLAENTLIAPAAGRVELHIEGYCLSTPGDRILLAVNNVADWDVNDGHVSIEAVDGDLNRSPFSHTRVYDVAAGSHTFYAVAENFVETDGDGTGSVFASFTLQYFPNVTSGNTDLLQTLAAQINVYPVPGNGAVFLDCSAWPDRQCSITLINSEGKILQQWQSENLANIPLDITEYPAGTYFLQISGITGMVTKTLIKN
jgi:ribosomal protein L31